MRVGKLRVIHILDNLDIGGKEKNVVDICNNLNSEKFKLTIICLYSSLNEEFVLNNNIDVVRLNLIKSKSSFFQLLFNFSQTIKIWKNLNRLKPNIVHTHTFFYSIIPILNCIYFLKGTIHFHTIHTGGMHYLNLSKTHTFKLYVERFFYKIHRTNLIAISQSLEKKVANLFPGRNVYLVQNGIYLDKVNIVNENISSQNYKGVYVARLVEGKNHETILKALSEICKKDLTLTFTFIGAGPLYDDLKMLTNKLGLQKKINFEGDIKDVKSKLKDFNFGIFASEYEGFSLALIEMMAEGFPVFISDSPTILDMGINKDNAIIFRTFDHLDLKNKMLMLFSESAKFIEYGKKARIFAEQFDLNIMIEQLEKIYKRQ